MHLEELSLSQIISNIKRQWREIQIEFTGDELVRADIRAVEGVLKNLIQNSYVHGKATQVLIGLEKQGPKISILIQDNGQGFKGEYKKLGQPFMRHSSTSGSGIGLYLSRRLLEKMNGKLEFLHNDKGFAAKVTLDRVVHG